LILGGVFVLAFGFPAFSTEPCPHVCFRVVDANHDGKVDFQEFKQVFSDAEKQDFDEIDSDRNASLSQDEYHHSLGHGNKSSKGTATPEKP
jgi:hypothetical protein